MIKAKKLAALLLTVLIIAGPACSRAESLTPGDLYGSWYAEYEGIIPVYCFLYADMTFETSIADDLPIEELSLAGSWDFDGETLVLRCAEKDLPFTWNGRSFSGELFGLQLELRSEWMGDVLETP